MADHQRKKFVYKVASFLKDPGANITLEKLLQSAVKKHKKALDRAENPDANVEFRFLNYTGTHLDKENPGTLYGCEFLAFEKNADHSTIKIDDNAEQVDVDIVLAKQGEEFLAGSVYFGVADNHVILVQSRGLRSKDLESYLNWFLIIKAKVLGEDNRVGLADHTPKKKSIKGVKGIEIKGSMQMEPVTMPKPSGKGEISKSKLVHIGGTAWEVIATLLKGAYDLPTELKVDDLSKLPNVEVKVFLKWKASKDEDDINFLNSIAKNLSHVGDEFDYTVKTKTGTIKKDEFKVEQDHTFKWGKGRPHFDDIFPKMASWLAELVQSGKIDV